MTTSLDQQRSDPKLFAADFYHTTPPRFGHEARIFNLQFRPNTSDWLATASDDNTVGIWRRSDPTSSFRQVAAYRGHSDSVMRVSWCPQDTSLLASGSSDTTVRLWRLSEAAERARGRSLGHAGCQHLTTLTDHPEEVYAIEWVANNPHQLVVASECSLFLWDLNHTSHTYSSPTTSAFSHLGSRGSGSTMQKIKSPEPEAKLESMPARWREGYIFGLAQQPGGAMLGAACSDGALRFWHRDSNTYSPLTALQWTDSVASDCAFSEDGALFAATSKDGCLLVTDTRVGSTLLHMKLPTALFSCRLVKIAGHDTVIAAASNGRVHLVDVTTAAVSVLEPEEGEEGWVMHAAAVSHDGGCIAAAGESMKVEEWDIEGFSLMEKMQQEVQQAGEGLDASVGVDTMNSSTEQHADNGSGFKAGLGLGARRQEKSRQEVRQKMGPQKWSPVHVWNRDTEVQTS